jgi:uncharacterized protein
MKRLTALITGASSGIGLELARLAAADGYDLVLVSRAADKLEALAGELRAAHACECHVISADLAISDGAARVVDELSRRHIRVAVLVNCAGVAARGAVATLTLQRQLDMIQLNMTSLTALTRLLLPQILEAKIGAVMNVASIAAYTAGPYMSVYYASKAFVLRFTEGLREELRGTGVKVSCLCPGPTRTAFAIEANVAELPAFRLTAMSASDVAAQGWRGLKQDKAVVIPGKRNVLARILLGLMPAFVTRGLVRALQGPARSSGA